jgi:hypothetical protein
MGFCNSRQGSTAPPVWADPLGPTSTGKRGVASYSTSGAPQYRNQLFSAMGGMGPTLNAAGADAASHIGAGVNAPQWGAAENLATRNLSGAYLNGSPALDRAMAANRSATMASAADATARTRAQYGRAGMGWSTGNQQAAQSGAATAAGEADRTNANTYLQNYLNERGIQNSAPGQFAAAKAAPLDYLSRAVQGALSPLTGQGNILSALSSGGQVITPGTTQTINPSAGSSVLNGWAGVIGNL